MNIFVLSPEGPEASARDQCDKHVVKMVLESAQLLCSPFDPGVAPYKRTHFNHPCSVWARSSKDNYLWLVEHALALSDEYSFRYGRTHKSQATIEWCRDRVSRLSLPDAGLTSLPQAMPEQYRGPDTVEAYRAYYIGDKARFARWDKGRPAPPWWPVAAA